MAHLDRMRSEPELPWVTRACSLAFGGTLEGCAEWLANIGHENVRLLHDGDDPLAALAMLPMGHFFGGRSVPVEGVAAVVVPPESRGHGGGRRLMHGQIRDAAESGVPLSSLFCSTQALYRQAGYEQAGVMFLHSIPLRTIGVRDRSMEVRALTDADEDAVRACYRRCAARWNGMLDRNENMWGRTRKHREETFTGFGIFAPADEGGSLEAYVFFVERSKPSGRFDLGVSDIAFTTPRAGRRLLGFLSDFAHVGDDAQMFGPSVHPLTSLMDQQYFSATFKDVWMLRLNLVGPALEARGYSPAIDTTIAFDITDDLVQQNRGVWTLRVRDGRGEVTKGAAGSPPVLRCDVRGLAAIYAGYRTPTQCAGLGWIEGEGLPLADGVFGGGESWVADPF